VLFGHATHLTDSKKNFEAPVSSGIICGEIDRPGSYSGVLSPNTAGTSRASEFLDLDNQPIVINYILTEAL
jgi:hypothetical protein